MEAVEFKDKFLNFFERRGHKIIPSAPLVPIDDPTSLFISAGMQPLVPYLLGEPHPLGKRLANVQKCLRTNDIDEVGDNRHFTFMEMLGNWSLGDYFKRQQLKWAFEFLTSKEWLNLDPKRLYISVFEGDKDAPRDEESIAIWQKIFQKRGLSYKVGERIFLYPKEKNWWGPVGETGPCGPDSEVFYDTKNPHCPEFGKKCHINCDCGRYIEIWNNVFMEYSKTGKGRYERLKQQNVDTGLGLERVVAILQDKETFYETELFVKIIQKIEKWSGASYRESKDQRSMRIIADHLRAATFVAAEGIVPSNVERGYVLRRLIRRAIRHARLLELRENFTTEIAQTVIKTYKKEYPELTKHQEKIFTELNQEERQFDKTLERGLKEFDKMIASLEGRVIAGDKAFHLYDTFGFPLELTRELADEKGLKVNEEEFKQAFSKHQEKSRLSTQKKFAGGLADQSVETTKLHTATHLLHAALRQVLGEHVQQKGSNITPERLRFDFTHSKSLTPKEIKKIEEIINARIRENLPVKVEVMPFTRAQKQGALAFFGERYPEKVKVYSIGNYSKEVCGGPHVDSTGQLVCVKITKSKSLGTGLQRIYARLFA